MDEIHKKNIFFAMIFTSIKKIDPKYFSSMQKLHHFENIYFGKGFL